MFVTGGSGFIGGRLVERLVGEGRPVRALARSDAAAQRVAELGAEPVRGDLGDRASLAAAAAGAEVAFHLAAHLGEWGTWEDFERGNVEGTRNVLAACAEAGRAALRPLRDRGGADGRRAAGPGRRDGAAAAGLAGALPGDQGAGRAGRAGRQPRGLRDRRAAPALRLGQGRHDAAAGDGRDGRSRQWAWVGGGRNVTDTAHVDNVVEGLVLAAEKGRPGEAYFVTDGEPVIFREFVTAMLRDPRASSRRTAACPPGPPRRWPASARRPGSSCRCRATRR